MLHSRRVFKRFNDDARSLERIFKYGYNFLVSLIRCVVVISRALQRALSRFRSGCIVYCNFA